MDIHDEKLLEIFIRDNFTDIKKQLSNLEKVMSQVTINSVMLEEMKENIKDIKSNYKEIFLRITMLEKWQYKIIGISIGAAMLISTLCTLTLFYFRIKGML